MLESMLFIRWGAGPGEATPRYAEIAAGGFQAQPHARRRIEPLRLRLDTAGGYHLHSPGDGAIFAFDAQRSLVGKIKVPVAGEVWDLAAGPAAYVALVGEGRRVLVAFDRTGAVVWRRDDLEGGVDRIVLARSGLFVAASSEPAGLIELDPSTGATRRRHDLPREALDPVAAPDGAIVAAAYFPEERRRGMLVYLPATGQVKAVAAGAELYGTLLGVVGATAAHELVVHGALRGDPRASLFVIGPDAQVRRRVGLDALLVPRPGEAVAARFGDGTLVLDGNGPGLPATIPLPDALRALPVERLTVVEADPQRVVVDVRGSDGVSAERRALDVTTGQVTTVASGTTPALVPGMQPRTTWQVAADGRVLIPVVSETGFTIVSIVP